MGVVRMGKLELGVGKMGEEVDGRFLLPWGGRLDSEVAHGRSSGR